MGSNIQQQLVAAGSSMGQPPSTSGTGGDSSMLVAVPTAAANVKLSFTGAFVGPCANDAADTEAAGVARGGAPSTLCPEGVVSVRLLYLADASVFLAANTSSSGRRHLLAPVAVSASDLELLSGSVQLAVGDQQQLPCDSSSSSSCSASLSIPLSSTVIAGDPQVQCLLLEGGVAYRGGAAGDGVVTAAVGAAVADCTVRQSGTYAVGRVRSLTVPPPASTPSSSGGGSLSSPTSNSPTSGSSSTSTSGSTSSSSSTSGTISTTTTAPTATSSGATVSTSATYSIPSHTTTTTTWPDTPPSSSTSPSLAPSASPFLTPQLGAAENSITIAAAYPAPVGKTYNTNLVFTFPVDFRALLPDAQKEVAFKNAIITSVAAAIKVPKAWIAVSRLRSGSVIADVVRERERERELRKEGREVPSRVRLSEGPIGVRITLGQPTIG